MQLKRLKKNVDKSCNYCGKICEGKWIKSLVCEECGVRIIAASNLVADGTPRGVLWAEHIRYEAMPYLEEMKNFLEERAVDEDDIVIAPADLPYIQGAFDGAMSNKSASFWISNFREPNRKKILNYLIVTALEGKIRKAWKWDVRGLVVSKR